MRYFYILLPLLFLIGCASQEQTSTLSSNNVQTEAAAIVLDADYDEQFHNANLLALYLPEDQSTLTFTNGQNTMTLLTNWLSASQVDIVQTLNGIDTVYSFEVVNNELLLTLQEQTFSYVTLPLTKSMGDWQYVKTLSRLQTPYGTFEEVHVFEHTFSGRVERHFIARQFGIVQFEVTQNNVVDSYQLQSIDY